MSSKNFVTTRVMSLLFCVMARGNELWLLLSFGWKFTFCKDHCLKSTLGNKRRKHFLSFLINTIQVHWKILLKRFTWDKQKLQNSREFWMTISLVSYLRISRETTPFLIVFLNFLSNQGFFITTTLSLKLVPQNLKNASWSCTLTLCNNILFILHSKIYLMWMDFGNSGFCLLSILAFLFHFQYL